jgi:hypothetical protein
MAVFMNAKGTTNTNYQIGKRGAKIFGGVATPTDAEVDTGDIWLDKSNNKTKIAYVNGGTVTWNQILTENYGDVTISGNLTVQGTQTTVNSTTVEVQNAMVFEGSTDDAHETTLTTIEPTADRTISLPNASGTLTLDGQIEVEDLKTTAYVAQGDTWNSDDSELATTGRIDQMIGTEIANSSVIMHTTGAESMAGVKTFSSGIVSNVTGDLTGDVKHSGSTVLDVSTGALTGTVSSISNHTTANLTENTNLYFTGARARNSLSLVDNGNGELSYNSSTGIFTWSGVTSSTTNVEKVTALSFGQLTDYGAVSSSTTLTSDFGNVATANVTFSDTGYIFTDSGLPQLPSYLVTTLPSSVSAGDLALCTNETGGATVVFFDGTNWRRMADRAVAS